MSSLFSGLEAFGLKNLDSHQVFEEIEEEPKKMKTMAKAVKRPMLYTRKLTCPVCGNTVDVLTVKKSVARLDSIDHLLRPVYSNIDPLCYDVILCEGCGYAALGRHFKKISDRQVKAVKEAISADFKGDTYPESYDHEIALKRYKLALLNDVVISRPEVDRAFTCLKTTWVLAALQEQTKDKTKKESYRQSMKEFARTAYEGFSRNYDTITFPVYGMSIDTYHYLLGTLAFHSDRIDAAMFWLNRVLMSYSCNERIKAKSRELKKKIAELRENAG